MNRRSYLKGCNINRLFHVQRFTRPAFWLRLKRALQVDGAIRGLHEVAKHVEACKAQVVFLAESCHQTALG